MTNIHSHSCRFWSIFRRA